MVKSFHVNVVCVFSIPDFECLVKPRKDEQHERIVKNHEAFSIGFYVKYVDSSCMVY